MTKAKTQTWIWKVTPLNRAGTKERWMGKRQDLKASEVWLCQEQTKGVWICKAIKGTNAKRK